MIFTLGKKQLRDLKNLKLIANKVLKRGEFRAIKVFCLFGKISLGRYRKYEKYVFYFVLTN